MPLSVLPRPMPYTLPSFFNGNVQFFASLNLVFSALSLPHHAPRPFTFLLYPHHALSLVRHTPPHAFLSTHTFTLLLAATNCTFIAISHTPTYALLHPIPPRFIPILGLNFALLSIQARLSLQAAASCTGHHHYTLLRLSEGHSCPAPPLTVLPRPMSTHPTSHCSTFVPRLTPFLWPTHKGQRWYASLQ